MPKQLLITRLCGAQIAIMQGDRLCQLLSEHPSAQAGDVYLAKVVRVVSALSVAFLDISEPNHAVLSLNQHNPITQGQSIIVQISRPAHAQKGAIATTAITLASPYMVYQPRQCGVRVSAKLDKASAKVLHDHATSIMSALAMTGALMIRTLAKDAQPQTNAYHIRHLHEVWQTILSNKACAKAPKRLYRMPLLCQALAQHTEVSAIYDDGALDKDWGKFLGEYLPDVALYQQPVGIFNRYNIYTKLKNALSRHLPLPSGAYLVIDECEAMTVIDVNTGTAPNSSANLIYQTNLQAIQTIAQILMLRQIGGLVAIDLIDMKDDRQKHNIYQSFKQELAKDIAKSSVLPINEFGVMMVSRERRFLSLTDEYTQSCPTCQGISMPTMSVACFGIIAELFDLSHDIHPKDTLILRVGADLYECLQTMSDYQVVSQRLAQTLQIKIMPDYDAHHHTLLKNKHR